MYEKVFCVRFHHPLSRAVLKAELPASAVFGDMLKLLYKKGFMEKKPADYCFIINRRICALNKPLSAYVPLDADAVDIEVNGLLSIMS